MHDLLVVDVTVGHECFFVLHSQKFNKIKKKAAFRILKNCHYQFLITSKDYWSFLLRSQG